jgi:uncharacterized membrane protein
MNNSENINSSVHSNETDHRRDIPLDPIGQNIENILSFHLREEEKMTRSQRALEVISEKLGRPICLTVITLLVVVWILVNILSNRFGFTAIDPAPFPLLQGVIGLGAFLTMIVLLIKQNRMVNIEKLQAHLELQINLLTEQKTTKLINLIEELRCDLPMIKNRDDPEAAAFQKPTHPDSVLEALDEYLEAGTLRSNEKNGKNEKDES